MDNFKVIYKILKYLDRNNGNEDYDINMISAETFGVPEPKWEQIIIELKRNDYIDGVVYSQNLDDKFPHIAHPITPRITLKGIEYLSENTIVKKAGNFVKGIKDTIPGM